MPMGPIRPEDGDSLFVPNLLTTHDQLQIIGEMIKQVQAELFRLEVTQAMNGHKESEVVPGSSQQYVKQREILESGLLRLQNAYPDHINLLKG